MRIALVADVKHQPVVRRIEDVMDRGRQLDDAKAKRDEIARMLATLG